MPTLEFKQKLTNGRSALRFLRKAILSPHSPLLAQLVVTRRCNLACGYCNEYDDFSPPVPRKTLEERIDALGRLNTAAVTLTGGEPLLNPDLEHALRRIRDHKMIATMITNGFRLNKKRIETLNKSGLQQMQISIDNLEEDEVSMKSLNSVKKKLILLSEHAKFRVNINSVLGISDERTEDALMVAETALALGFDHTSGILHDENGILKPLSERQLAVYKKIETMSNSFNYRLNYHLFQGNLIRGEPNDWRCRAGARYLYICEDGKVHWCSQQRGYPGIPVTEYQKSDVAREYKTKKDCSPNCTLSCVHQSSMFDHWRGKQTLPEPNKGISVKIA